MTQQGAALQSYNNELVKCIEELCAKRDELSRQIRLEEEEKGKLQSDIRLLTERLARLNESLARKMASRNEFDKTIAETEAAYVKILESSQTLLNVLKKEAGNLAKATESKNLPAKDS
ncbi:microtubule nucleation factor SSNA1 [Candoia aspera]|uniref:microtubule nucleation factor SSNA1 n=1 Tax=Candoia aspera TaxID=51853 RepID=UPI002FD7DD12